MRRRKSCWSASKPALALALLLAPLAAPAAEPVAKAAFTQGVVTAQARDESAPRILGKDAPLHANDTVTTGSKSFVILEFVDGAKTTLRPDSVFSVEAYVQKEGKEQISLNLLKGGLRTITGTVGKRKPESYQLRTPVATIGIRGTEFDARLCAADCAAEAANLKAGVRAPTAQKTALVAAGLQRAILQSAVAATPGAEVQPGLYVSVTTGRAVINALQGLGTAGGPQPPGPVGAPGGAQPPPALPGLGKAGGPRPPGVPVTPAPRAIEVGAGRAAFVDAGNLKVTPLAQPPAFMQRDPYPQPGRVDTKTLQLWNVIKGNDDKKQDDKPGGCPTP